MAPTNMDIKAVNDPVHVQDECSVFSEKAIAAREVSLQILESTNPEYTEFLT